MSRWQADFSYGASRGTSALIAPVRAGPVLFSPAGLHFRAQHAPMRACFLKMEDLFCSDPGIVMDRFKHYASLGSEEMTLEASAAGGGLGRLDLMDEYFKLHKLNSVNLDIMLTQAVYRDRVDLLMGYLDNSPVELVEFYFKMACSIYSQECAEFLAYYPRLGMDEETKTRWLKSHGSAEERSAQIKLQSSQNWGANDILLRTINIEGLERKGAAIKACGRPDLAKELFKLSLIYGCRNPEIFLISARAAGYSKDFIYNNIMEWGRPHLFAHVKEKCGLPRNLRGVAEKAAKEGRISILRILLANGAFDNVEVLKSCCELTRLHFRVSCSKFLEDTARVLGYLGIETPDNPACFLSTKESSCALTSPHGKPKSRNRVTST